MNELERLIDQQRRELLAPTKVRHWSRRSVATQASLDFDLSAQRDGSLTLADVLVEGVNAWLPWAFAPVSEAATAEDRALFVADVLTAAEVADYHATWGGGA